MRRVLVTDILSTPRPTDTPYTGGVYEFDILFPVKAPGYPSVPPKVWCFLLLQSVQFVVSGQVQDDRGRVCQVQPQPLQ